MFGWGIICKVQELSSLSKVLENYAPKLLFKQWFQCEKNRKKNNENSNHNTFKQTGLYFQLKAYLLSLCIYIPLQVLIQIKVPKQICSVDYL